MSFIISEAISAIEAQQPKERSTVWMVGEQLKDMCRNDDAVAEIILTDLRSNPQMTLAAAERKIAERANQNKVGSSGCVSPVEAENILREFFGLGSDDQKPSAQPRSLKLIEFADFL